MSQLIEQKSKTEEIEIKIKISDKELEILMKSLSQNAEFFCENLQEDYYFNNPNHSWFLEHQDGYRYALKYLRVRISAYGDTICFKDWETASYAGNAGLYCKDIETHISDGHVMISLLEQIGFTDRTKFKKYRKSYIYTDFEISIDTVDGLGTFVEFEVKKRKYQDPHAEYERILEFIKELGIKNYTIQKQGFIILLWNPGFAFN